MTSIFKKIPDSERNVNASLYFGNLDPQCSETLMYELFLQFGPIKNLHMPKDRINKIHQGYGFIEFENPSDAKYSEDILRGVRLYGKVLKLKQLDFKTQQPQSSTQYKQIGTFVDTKSTLLNDKFIDVGAKLFINNLNPLIDDKFLYNTFSKFGTIIKQPEIKRDIEGQSLGYGFITFGDFETSDLVIEKMNNVILMNSKINISYAFKNDVSVNGKKLRHGDKAERVLAENAKKNNVNVTKKQGKVSKKKRQ
ncbi:sap49 [Candida pseudojiufengensis]|uniref:sap49 n=1 Tax=Candida pseudojiufengensis TaxID=497109 RepID=UPI00222531FA|nr:sap49 [Candida pseudojiufengensis]KAI5965295.1 sap49 [Candida pseudojiufengensis]